MSQKNNTVNFLIHDTNGQPQMVKVVQNTSKQPTAQIKINNALKVIKVPNTTSDASQQPAVYRAVKVTNIKGASKLVQVPIHTLAQLQKSGGEPLMQSPSQEEKVQAQSIHEVMHTMPDLVPIPARHTTVVATAAPSPLPPSVPASNSKTVPPPIMAHLPRKRHDDSPVPEYTTKRRKHADKVGKGLRHFSMKVCEKVRNKGFTSYNEVADELVEEFAAGMHGSADSQQYDQKNIRRRVYDALNVLMAMNIISKEKKEIRWLGLPTNSIQECNTLEAEKQARLAKIQAKAKKLDGLILQHISYKSLIERNKLAESKGIRPSAASMIHLPFIAINTSDNAIINCSISNDKREYMFHLNKMFRIHDDTNILKIMGLLYGLDKGECTESDLERLKSMIPKSLESYVENMGRGVTRKLSDILEADVSADEEEEAEAHVQEEMAEAGNGSEAEEAGDGSEAEEAGDGSEAEEAEGEHADDDYTDDSDDLDV